MHFPVPFPENGEMATMKRESISYHVVLLLNFAPSQPVLANTMVQMLEAGLLDIPASYVMDAVAVASQADDSSQRLT